jgi:hypothetical protein
MRIPVYLKGQDPAQAPASHSASTALCQLVLACGCGVLATVDGRRVLKLSTDETWRALKDRLKPDKHGHVIVRLKAPRKPLALDLSYPEKGRESGRHPHEAMLKQCIVIREKRKALLAQANASTGAQASAQAQESTAV